MIRIIGCIRDQHDPLLVVLAAAICFISCLGSIRVWWLGSDVPAVSRRQSVLLAGLASGFGVWATHFIAMIAYLPGLPVTYDLPLVLASLGIAVTLICAGLSITESYRTSGSWLAGGTIIGLAISAMHYLGAQSMSLPGRIGWSPDLVAASPVISIVAASAALKLASGNRNLATLVLSASMLACAVVGLHFTAMTALIIIPDPSFSSFGGDLTATGVLLTIAGVAVVLLTVGGLFITRARWGSAISPNGKLSS
jgi:NO-binding membrane sensor protein with MHYT domain